MTVDVLKLQGDYRLSAGTGGTITLDTSGGVNLTGTASPNGNVVVTGSLTVYGDTIFGSITNQVVENTKISDNVIVLNDGQPGSNQITAAGNKAGIIIDRGDNANLALAGQLYLDDSLATGRWDLMAASGDPSQRNRGTWRLKVNDKASVVSVAGIKFTPIPGSYTSNGSYGTGNIPRLSLIGADLSISNSAIVSVKGVNDYAGMLELYGEPDDIPNKQYVDNRLNGATTEYANTASMVRAKMINGDWGNSFITITDRLENSTGQISFFIDDYLTAEFGPNSVQLAELTIAGTTIQPFFTGTNITLLTTDGAEVIVNSALTYQVPDAEPQASPNQVKVYSTSTAGAGGTGLMFVNPDQRDELVSSRKMMIYSIIF